MTKKNQQLAGSLCLLLAAFIWGISFVAQTTGMEYVGPFTFQGVRFLLGAIVLLPVSLISDRAKKKQPSYTPMTKQEKYYLIKAGTVCGIILAIAANIQQLALQYTTPGKGGFITAMYILCVPVLGIFVKKRVGVKVWTGVGIAAVGLYFLCMDEALSINRGDLMLMLCALGFSFHIIFVDKYSPNCDGIKLSIFQFAVAAVISLAIMFITEKPDIGDILNAWMPICYSGILSCAGGYTLQIIGQKKSSNPTVDSLLMSLESVFSVLAQMVILRDIPTGREFLGCALMFTAIILAQLPDKRSIKKV